MVYLDLDQVDTMAPALEGIDRLFMVTGYTIDMLRQSKDLLNAAKRAGVKHVVHLGACGNDDTRIAHHAWHQFVERYIEWSGFSFTHLRPEIFIKICSATVARVTLKRASFVITSGQHG